MREQPAKRLIINADDFGLSPGINKGIIRAVKAGVVTSATLLTQGPAFREAIEAAPADLGLGVHLNLTGGWGMPKGGAPVGFYTNNPALLLWRCFAGRVDLTFAQTELRKQIEAFAKIGDLPTHLDGHHHIHVFPGMAELVAELAVEYNIPSIRLPRPSFSLWRRPLIKRTLMGQLATKAGRLFEARGLKFPPGFWGFSLYGSGDFGWRLQAVLEKIEAGTHEIMSHPGLPGPDFTLDAYRQARIVECEALCDPKVLEKIRECGISLVSYADLS